MNWYKECMNTAPIRNGDLQEILDQYVELVAKRVPFGNGIILDDDIDMDWYTSDEYLAQVVDAGRGHDGYPERLLGVSTSATDKMNVTDLTLWKDIQDETERLCTEMLCFLGANNKALTAVYPPGGGISWHNNANASAYNIIFTWSEKGDGYWEHLDPVSKERVRIPDVQGWQCKFGYFGSYEDGPTRLCYHKARTNCLRMTIGFMFNSNENGKNMAEMVIEEIQTA